MTITNLIKIGVGLSGGFAFAGLRTGLFGFGKEIHTDENTLGKSIVNYGVFTRAEIWQDRDILVDKNFNVIPLKPNVEYRFKPFIVHDDLKKTFKQY